LCSGTPPTAPLPGACWTARFVGLCPRPRLPHCALERFRSACVAPVGKFPPCEPAQFVDRSREPIHIRLTITDHRMQTRRHEHVGPYQQAFLPDAMVEAVDYDHARLLSDDNREPLCHRKRDIVDSCTFGYLVAFHTDSLFASWVETSGQVWCGVGDPRTAWALFAWKRWVNPRDSTLTPTLSLPGRGGYWPPTHSTPSTLSTPRSPSTTSRIRPLTCRCGTSRSRLLGSVGERRRGRARRWRRLRLSSDLPSNRRCSPNVRLL
jgi:hypothetical protein